MTIKKSELQDILSTVENEIADLLKSQSGKLRKAGEPGEASAGGADDGAGGPDSSATAPAPSAPGDASAGAPEGAPAEGAPAEGAPAEGAPAEGAPGEGQPADPAALEAEYEKLPPEELKAHYLACKAALMKVMGGQEQGAEGGAPGAPPAPEGAAPEGAAPEGAGAPPPGAAPAGPEGSAPPPQMKSQMPANKANGGMVKSETDTLKEQVTLLTKALTMFVEAPSRKAATSIPSGMVASGTPMTKSEITAKLTAVTADPKLSKANRDLVDGYYNRSVSVESIKHLLVS